MRLGTQWLHRIYRLTSTEIAKPTIVRWLESVCGTWIALVPCRQCPGWHHYSVRHRGPISWFAVHTADTCCRRPASRRANKVRMKGIQSIQNLYLLPACANAYPRAHHKRRRRRRNTNPKLDQVELVEPIIQKHNQSQNLLVGGRLTQENEHPYMVSFKQLGKQSKI